MADIVTVQINVGGEGQYFFRYSLAPGYTESPGQREPEQLPEVRVLPLNTSILAPGLSLPIAAGHSLPSL